MFTTTAAITDSAAIAIVGPRRRAAGRIQSGCMRGLRTQRPEPADVQGATGGYTRTGHRGSGRGQGGQRRGDLD